MKKIPKKLSAQAVSILMDINRTTFKEREIFWKAYKHNCMTGEYTLHDRKFAEQIADKLNMKGLTDG